MSVDRPIIVCSEDSMVVESWLVSCEECGVVVVCDSFDAAEKDCWEHDEDTDHVVIVVPIPKFLVDSGAAPIIRIRSHRGKVVGKKPENRRRAWGSR